MDERPAPPPGEAMTAPADRSLAATYALVLTLEAFVIIALWLLGRWFA